MTFRDWYESVYEEEWQEDEALMTGIATQLIEEYEMYCRENYTQPIWDG